MKRKIFQSDRIWQKKLGNKIVKPIFHFNFRYQLSQEVITISAYVCFVLLSNKQIKS